MRKYLLLFGSLLVCSFIYAQGGKMGYGFRAGLSFSKIDGPSELGPNGEMLEEFKMGTGFHIGMAFSYKMTDIFGFRGEFLYSQRGTEYNYDGPSYYILRGSSQPLTIFGSRRQTLTVSNAFIDLPLTAYYKIGYFEIYGGLNTGLLISSTGVGTVEFEGTSPLGNAVPTFEVNLNHNYKKDDAGFASEVKSNIQVDGKTYELPEFVGAYYDFTTKEEDLYKPLDFGITAGVSYFLNDGLYLSARYIFGLSDVDRNFYDQSLRNINNGIPEKRADENKSKSWQFSVGFSF